MSEKREYEDYEELGRNIREAYQSLHDIDLHKANETLRAAVAKAASMWGDEDPQMTVAVSSLRSLQQLELQPYIEWPDLEGPGIDRNLRIYLEVDRPESCVVGLRP